MPGTDRARLERLCRYAARPPLAQERLTQLHDGRLRLELKKPWADGTTAFVMEPLDFIARLVAAIPPPRFHMIRSHGVLAPHSALRPLVVPKLESEIESEVAVIQLPLFVDAAVAQQHTPLDTERIEPAYKGRHPGRQPWALLLRHVFAADVTVCAHCQGRMRLGALCTTPDAIALAMAHAGLAPRPPPPITPGARGHPLQVPLPLG